MPGEKPSTAIAAMTSCSIVTGFHFTNNKVLEMLSTSSVKIKFINFMGQPISGNPLQY